MQYGSNSKKTNSNSVASLERLGEDLDFGLGVAEAEVCDDKVVGPVELGPQVEVSGGVLPVVDPDARVAGGEGVEEGRQAVLLQVGDLALDLLVPATRKVAYGATYRDGLKYASQVL